MPNKLLTDEELKKEHGFLLQKYLHAITDTSGDAWVQEERIAKAEDDLLDLIKQQKLAHGDEAELRQVNVLIAIHDRAVKTSLITALHRAKENIEQRIEQRERNV